MGVILRGRYWMWGGLFEIGSSEDMLEITELENRIVEHIEKIYLVRGRFKQGNGVL
jgi:hypothetical protein